MGQAVLFPGQGSQFVGMSADLIDRCPEVEEMFTEASRLLGEDLWKLTTDGPEDVLESTAVSQPAIFVVSLAVLRVLEAAGAGERLSAVGTAGLSLGEYSALVFAGSLGFSEALEIVVRRGEYMQEACDQHPSGMSSILGLDLETVSEVVKESASAGVIAVANVNSKSQIVVSGEHAALEKAAEVAQEKGALKVVPLSVAGAYHSPLMATATEKLRPFLEKANISAPRIPFYGNAFGRRVSEVSEIREGLIRQVESSVLWEPILTRLVSDGMTSVLEPGPGRVVAGIVKRIDRRMPVKSVLTAESVEDFLSN